MEGLTIWKIASELGMNVAVFCLCAWLVIFIVKSLSKTIEKLSGSVDKLISHMERFTDRVRMEHENSSKQHENLQEQHKEILEIAGRINGHKNG